MTDFPYNPEYVSDDIRPIFDQLVKEFGDSHQIWRRIESLGCRLSAGVLNPETNVAVTIKLRTTTWARRNIFSEDEVQQIREHFSSGAKEDLAL